MCANLVGKPKEPQLSSIIFLNNLRMLAHEERQDTSFL